jgi:hypothetical protein
MTALLSLIRGWPGKPSHPPLTDASIGAYTVGVAMLVVGKLGLQTPQMAVGSLIAISSGLLLGLPTARDGVPGLAPDTRRTPTRTVATIHLFTMLTATVHLVEPAARLRRRRHPDPRSGGRPDR